MVGLPCICVPSQEGIRLSRCVGAPHGVSEQNEGLTNYNSVFPLILFSIYV